MFRRWLQTPRILRFGLILALLGTFWILLDGPELTSAQSKLAEIKATDPGAKVPWEIDANIGIQMAARVNFWGLTALVLLLPWWARPFRVAAADPASVANSTQPWPRWAWQMLCILVLLGAALRLPLASGSLWWDELWSIRQCSHGQWRTVSNDSEVTAPDHPATEGLEFRPSTWKRCAFYYQKPTNHAPMSLAQKASLDAWRTVTGAHSHEFSDFAARFPAWFASLLTLGLAGLLLRNWSLPPASALAGVMLLAIHPMAIRYGVDARGYALVLPLVLSALLAVTRLARSGGRGGWTWAWLGLNQCLWLWAFPNGILDVAVMTLILAGWLGFSHHDWRDRGTAWLRLLVAHLLSGMLFLQLFLPNAMQALRWAGQEDQGHQLNVGLLWNAITQVTTGLLWRGAGSGGDLATGLPELKPLFGHPMLAFAVVMWIGLCALAGIWVLRKRHAPAGGAFLTGLVISAVGFAVIGWQLDFYFYSRFWIALVPVTILGLASSMAGGGWRALPGLTAFAMLGTTSLIGGRHLLERPIEPVRDVSQWLDHHGSQVVLAFGHGREALQVYWPNAIPLATPGEIEDALRHASKSGRTVHLVMGHLGFNRSLLAPGTAFIEDSERFVEVQRFNGIESEFQYRIYRVR